MFEWLPDRGLFREEGRGKKGWNGVWWLFGLVKFLARERERERERGKEEIEKKSRAKTFFIGGSLRVVR